eukprot:TRINITY_DN5154_c0_g2_i1.p1 TRINITY_DN5154_c0_g2~~TRINITY_DN5154_c0_g2_i1.p1  ORF type:complete len:518 (+),score=112.05 TRINITY_DN5154_c0_g2_i1:275-1828(+)
MTNMKIEEELDPLATKYLNGEGVPLKNINDIKLKGRLASKENLYKRSANYAAKFEKWLLPSEAGYLEAEGLEKTCNFKQESIVQEVDLLSARKAFDIKLEDFGPYCVDYSLNGCYMLIAGRKGHVAMMEWKNLRRIMELQLKETVRDVKFLHNEIFFAAAQKKYIYIYDKMGTEIHCIKEHVSPLKLEFLPKHFLLASINKLGVLRYQDTSTGTVVSQHRTNLGRCDIMRMNPFNAVIGLGHNNGTVTMWSPNMSTPLISMLCHRGPITAVGFDIHGRHMVTAGLDKKVKVWDLRQYKPLHFVCSSHAKTLDISQRDLLVLGCGSKIEVWKDALAERPSRPYIRHRLVNGSQINNVAFCPYEDVLAIGHSTGMSSILVPGSGEPNFDAFVANPFETLKQRREKEVHALLDKLQPEMIVLDPENIGSIIRPQKEVRQAKHQQEQEANLAAALAAGKTVSNKKKTKGRNKAGKRHKKKMENVIRAKRPVIEEQLENEKPVKRQKHNTLELPVALQRFAK